MTSILSPETAAVLWAVFRSVVILLVVVLFAAYLSFFERRLLALWQDRYGPNRVGWEGIFQLPADVVKMLFKEDWIPPFADRATFMLAPVISMCTLLLAFMIVPVTPSWRVADFDIGILFFLAMAGIAIYAVLLAGWSSDSKYALLGALRVAAQTLSYEVFMGLSLMGVVALTGSFNMGDIVEAQRGMWFVVPQFLGFMTFALAAVAVAHRAPFDLPEAEQELAAGYHTEYAGMKWAMFFVGEYIGIVVISALIATLFFGGWLGPGPEWLAPLWFTLKTLFFVMLFVLLRAALPRPRYDHMMMAGWMYCLPITLLNLLLTGAVLLARG